VSKYWYWWLWGSLTLMGAGYLALGLLKADAASSPILSPARAFLLPGKTTHGHYQIELQCESCHTSAFGGIEVLQEACMNCHGDELKESNDKHPRSKFTDPRNAELLEKIDATMCVACHSEHRPAQTNLMGLTVPNDVCAHCHQGIAEERPSHKGMGFDTCASSGCHNYHDNRALYEDFLLKHADEARVHASPVLRKRDFIEIAAMLPGYPSKQFPVKQLATSDIDAPKELAIAPHTDDWLASSHAKAGVNCTACHTSSDATGDPAGDATADASGATANQWIAKPERQVCANCHALEVAGFERGKHGMRVAQGLDAMTPGEARLPMREDAHDQALRCNSCHSAHRFDTQRAAVEGCLSCHDDQHSRAYKESSHFRLWQAELAGTAAAGTGVSCASCHLPRLQHTDNLYDISRALVQHNQNDTLRPNEKMLRPVCMTCHGMGFSMDALADRDLIDRNFAGAPQVHIESIEMAVKRDVESRSQ
jgi:predicted CXXCH cytochrome family protein